MGLQQQKHNLTFRCAWNRSGPTLHRCACAAASLLSGAPTASRWIETTTCSGEILLYVMPTWNATLSWVGNSASEWDCSPPPTTSPIDCWNWASANRTATVLIATLFHISPVMLWNCDLSAARWGYGIGHSYPVRLYLEIRKRLEYPDYVRHSYPALTSPSSKLIYRLIPVADPTLYDGTLSYVVFHYLSPSPNPNSRTPSDFLRPLYATTALRTYWFIL